MKIQEIQKDNNILKVDMMRDVVIYFLCKGDEIVYVGSTKHLLYRLGQHMHYKDFDSAYYTTCSSAENRGKMEDYFIKLCNPRLNKEPSLGRHKVTKKDMEFDLTPVLIRHGIVHLIKVV